jgi:hypothetical protein
MACADITTLYLPLGIIRIYMRLSIQSRLDLIGIHRKRGNSYVHTHDSLGFCDNPDFAIDHSRNRWPLSKGEFVYIRGQNPKRKRARTKVRKRSLRNQVFSFILSHMYIEKFNLRRNERKKELDF